jgi:hypothetical protein
MDGGRRLWFEGVELGRAKVGSVEDVVARITGAEKKGRGMRVRIIARIRVGGGMTRAQQHTIICEWGEIRPVEEPAPIVKDGWGWEVSAGPRQIWLRLCHGL